MNILRLDLQIAVNSKEEFESKNETFDFKEKRHDIKKSRLLLELHPIIRS
jgi:hypothetical protein